MKRISLGIIIIAVLMLIGYKNTIADRQNDISTGAEINENTEVAVMEQPDRSDNPSKCQSSNLPSSLTSSSSITNVFENSGLKIFEDQSFLTNFENFGEVRFVSGGMEGGNPFELRF